MKTKERLVKSKEVLFKKYGKDAFKIIGKKGLKALKNKYGKKWYDITLTKGRLTLRKKYGENWQKELSKLAMKSLKKKYGRDYRKKWGYANISNLLKKRKGTKTETLIKNYLKNNNIKFESNFIKNNLEFDILIPNSKNPKYIIEISDAKPTTYVQRMKIFKLYYQKLLFPKAQHLAFLRCKSKGCSLHKITKQFLDKNNIKLFSLEKIKTNMPEIIKSIKYGRKLHIREEFLFDKRTIENSFSGCLSQSKRINKNEAKLNKILLKIGAKTTGQNILRVKDKCFICVDNFEIYKGNNILYEVTSSVSDNVIKSLAGKILLYKAFNKVKFIVVIDKPKIKNNYLNLLENIVDALIFKEEFNEINLLKIRKNII